MLRHLMLKPKMVNRLAIMGILPMMVFAIMASTQGGSAKSIPPEAPREGTLVVANLRGESITIHSLGGDGQQRTLALPGAPHELIAAAGRVYATIPREDTILEIDPRAPGLLRALEAGPMVHGLVLGADDTLVATVDGSKQAVTIDRASFEPLAKFATGDTPHTVAVLDGQILVTDSRDGNLRRIDPGTGEATTVAAGSLPESITVAGGYVAVADAQGGRLLWFTPDLELVGSIFLGGTPIRVLRVDDTRVAVSLNSAGAVAVVSLVTGDIEKRFKVAGHPDGLCLSPSGRFLAVASNEHDSLNIFRTEDWKLMLTLGAGDGPGACTWL